MKLSKWKNWKKITRKNKFLSLSIGSLLVGTIVPLSVQINNGIIAQKQEAEQEAFLNALFDQLNKQEDQPENLLAEKENKTPAIRAEETPFDEATWWADRLELPSTLTDLPGTPPSASIKLDDFLNSNKDVYNSNIATWISKNQNSAIDPGDFIKIYQNDAEVESIATVASSNEINFAFSTPNRHDKGEDFAMTITWEKSANEELATTYITKIESLGTIIGRPIDEKMKKTFNIDDVVNWLDDEYKIHEPAGLIEKTPAGLLDSLELLDVEGNLRSSITADKEKDYVEFKVRFPQHDKDNTIWTSDVIKISWTASANAAAAENFWYTVVLTNGELKHDPLEEAPNSTYNIFDIIALLGLPNPKTFIPKWEDSENKFSSLSGNYFLLPSNATSVIAGVELSTADDENELAFQLAFPKDGNTNPAKTTSLSDYFIVNVNLSWPKTRNQISAQTYWDNTVNSIIDKTIDGPPPVAPDKFDINYVLSQLGLSQPWMLEGKLTLFALDKDNNPVLFDPSYTFGPNQTQLSFQIGFPSNGVSGQTSGLDWEKQWIFTSTITTFEWTQTTNEVAATAWWEKAPNESIDLGIQEVPKVINLASFTTDTGYFSSHFWSWMQARPMQEDGTTPTVDPKLYWKNTSGDWEEITGDLKILSNVSHLDIKLIYPEWGVWTRDGEDSPLLPAKEFSIGWDFSRDNVVATNFWTGIVNKIKSIFFGSGSNEETIAPNGEYSLADILVIFNNIASKPVVEGDDGIGIASLELYQGDVTNKVDKIVVDDDQSSVTFGLRYPINAKNGSKAADYYFKEVTWTWIETRDEKSLRHWWESMPGKDASETVIDLKTMDINNPAVAPENITIDDFIGENGAFSNFQMPSELVTFKAWWDSYNTYLTELAKQDLRLFDNADKETSLLTIEHTEDSVSLTLKYPQNGKPWSEATSFLTHKYTISWDLGINNNMAREYWNYVLEQITNGPVDSEKLLSMSYDAKTNTNNFEFKGEAPSQYDLTALKTDFAIKLASIFKPEDKNYELLNDKLLFFDLDDKLSNLITIDNITKTINFKITLPINGTDTDNGTSGANFYVRNIQITWEQTHNEADIAEWFASWQDSYSNLDNEVTYPSSPFDTFVPDQFASSDLAFLKTVLANKPTWFNFDNLIIKDQNEKAITFPYTPDYTLDNVKFHFYVPQNGNDSIETFDQEITFLFAQSNNAYYSEKWANSLTGPATLPLPAGPPGNLNEDGKIEFSVSDLEKWITNLATDPRKNDSKGIAPLIGNWRFKMTDGSYSDTITMKQTDPGIDFTLAFPKNGVDNASGYWEKEFRLKWEKTFIEGQVDTWFNSITNDNTLTWDLPAISYSLDELKALLTIATPPEGVDDSTLYIYPLGTNVEDVKLHQGTGSASANVGYGALSSLDKINIDADTHEITIVIGTNSWNTEQDELAKEITFTWNQSRNSKVINDWLNNLNKDIKISDEYPPELVSFANLKTILGLDNLPKINDNTDTLSGEPVLVEWSGSEFINIDSENPLLIDANTSKVTIQVKFPLPEGGFSSDYTFDITWGEGESGTSRQEYLNNLINLVNTSKSELDGIHGKYTAQNVIFNDIATYPEKAILQWMLDTNRLPHTQAEIDDLLSKESINSIFNTAIAGLGITINSITEVPGTSKLVDPADVFTFVRTLEFNLSFSFLGATTTKTMRIDYNEANITYNPKLTSSDFKNQLDKIKISGSTNEPKIYLPEEVLTYFTNLHLIPTLVIDYGKSIINNKNIELIKEALTLVEIDGKNYYEIILDKANFGNLDSENDLTFKLAVKPEAGFNPTDDIDSIANAVSVERHFDIYIDTTSLQMWEDEANLNGLVSVLSSEDGVKLNTNNWKLQENIPLESNYILEYQFVYNDEKYSKYGPSVTESPWISDVSQLNGSEFPLWDQFINNATDNGNYRGYVNVRIKPNRTDGNIDINLQNNSLYEGSGDANYVVSNQRETTMNDSILTKMEQVVNFGSINDYENNNWDGSSSDVTANILNQLIVQIKLAIQNSSDTSHLNWDYVKSGESISVRAKIADILKRNHLQIEYAVKKDISDEPIWEDTLPSSLLYDFNERFFKIKVTPETNYQIQGQTTWELASASEGAIAPEIIAEIMALTGYIEAPDITSAVLEGTTKTFTIDFEGDFYGESRNLTTLPTGLKYEYSINGGSSWIDESAFRDFLADPKNINLIKKDIKYQIVVIDNKYKLSEAVEDTFNVDKLSTFLDISELAKLFTGFSYDGQLGKGTVTLKWDWSNGSGLDKLLPNALAQKRLKMQYKMSVGDVATWTDLPVGTLDGQTYVIDLATNVLPKDGEKVTITYRLVPYLKDGEIPSDLSVVPNRNIEDKSDWVGDINSLSSYETYTTTSLSTNFEHTENIILPIIIATPEIKDEYIAFDGEHTRALNMQFTDPINGGATADFALAIYNHIKNGYGGAIDKAYWNNLDWAFSIADSQGSEMYAFSADTFIKWLKGDYASEALPTVWQLQDSVTHAQLAPQNMLQVTLPNANKIPNWNKLDMDSITVRWVTKTASLDPEKGDMYIPSDTTVVNLKDVFDIRKWFDVSNILNDVNNYKIVGTTKDNDYAIVNRDGSEIDSNALILFDYLNDNNMQREISVDGTNWFKSNSNDDLPKYLDWATKNNRKLYLRLVPLHPDNTSGNANIYGTDIYLSYPVGVEYTEFDTTTTTGSQRDFRVWVDADLAALNNVAIAGNQFTLDINAASEDISSYVDSTGIEEKLKKEDDNFKKDDYEVLEIQYLYGENWYNKEDLVIQLQNNRQNAKTNGWGSFNPPSNFSHDNVTVRWHLKGDGITDPTNDYVIANALSEDPNYSTSQSAIANELLDFVNLWSMQAKDISFYEGKDGTRTDYGNFTDYNDANNESGFINIGGTLNGVNVTFNSELIKDLLAAGKIKMQYTTVEHPGIAITSGDWQNIDTSGWTNNSFEILSKIPLDNSHKSLYIRFLSNDESMYTTSSTLNGGHSDNILPIRLYTEGMKFSITTNSEALKNLNLLGDTQNISSDNIASYFDGTTTGIDYKQQVDGQTELQEVPLKDRAAWVAKNGIIIKWRAKQTRQKAGALEPIDDLKDPNYGYVVFNSFEELIASLENNTFNFAKDTLQISWAIADTMSDTNEVTDKTWVAPTFDSDFLEAIFAKDFITLTNKTLDLSGNTRKLNYEVNTDFASQIYQLDDLFVLKDELQNLKLQYSLNQSDWSDTLPTQIGGNKKIYLRLAPTDGYKIMADNSSDPANDETNESLIKQNTLLDTTYVQIALNLDGEVLNYFKDTLASSSISGYTTFGIENKTYTLNDLPNIYAADDGNTVGRWEYQYQDLSIWEDKLENALIQNYYDTKVISFDKDFQDFFNIRFELKAEQKPVDVDGKLEGGYILTHQDGSEFTSADLKQEISILDLKQLLYFDKPDSNINNMNPISWREMANQDVFLPEFEPSVENGKASYTKMTHNGNSYLEVDGKNQSAYKFDHNPYGEQKWDLFRSKDNALAPRHAHFVYTYIDSDGNEHKLNENDISSWDDFVLESNRAPFKVSIEADEGYEITDDVDWIGDGGLEKQSWDREFQIVIIKDVSGLSAGEATFIGFDGSGSFETNAFGVEGNPTFSLTKDGAIWNTYRNEGEAFVFEYRVLASDKTTEIKWTDSNNDSHTGWNQFAEAPGAEISWKGYMPISLKNGDIVEMRLRARDGYFLRDPESTSWDSNTQRASWSKAYQFTVSNLKYELTVPNEFQIYDSNVDHRVDFYGKAITNNEKMPHVTYSGSESHGKLTIDKGVNNEELKSFLSNVNFQVQVLRPFAPANSPREATNSDHLPRYGYNVLDNTGEIVQDLTGTPITVMEVGNTDQTEEQWTFDWMSGLDNFANTWVDPSDIDYLQVHDAIRIRVTANDGYAFKWTDDNYLETDDVLWNPKGYVQYAYNRDGIMDKGVDETNSTPLPVSGLLVDPGVDLANVDLKYSDKINERVNGNAVIEMTEMPTRNDKWKYQYRIKYAGQSSFEPIYYDTIPENVTNETKIEVTIKPKDGYVLDPSFKTEYNNVITAGKNIKTVSGLKNKIDSDEIERPTLTFAGYEKEGMIAKIAPEVPSQNTSDGTKEEVANVQYEYQVAPFGFDPSKAREKDVIDLPWLTDMTAEELSKLQVNQYVRVRVVAQNADDYVLPEVYSQPSDFEGDQDYQKGWIKVNNLKIDDEKINIKSIINGFVGQNSIVVIKDSDYLNEAFDIEYRWKKQGSEYSEWTSDNPEADLVNGDLYSLRLVARPGYIFENPLEDILLEGMHPYDALDSEGQTQHYLAFDGWTDIEVTDLFKLLDVTKVEFEGEFTIKPLEGKDLINGKVTVDPPTVIKEKRVEDAAGDVSTTNSEGEVIYYHEKVGTRYKIERINANGDYTTPFYLENPPQNLRNGDKVTLELYSLDDEYKLFPNKSESITIGKLIEGELDIKIPNLIFFGAPGEGSIAIDPAPQGRRYQYAVLKPGEELPTEENIEWVDQKPMNLDNGDLVNVRMIVNGTEEPVLISKDGETIPVITGWTSVFNLYISVDLSKHSLPIFNEENPYNPNENNENINYAFKLNGNHNGETSLEIASPLWTTDVENILKDKEGVILPEADKLKWEFYVDDEPKITTSATWSSGLPNDLQSEQYVHARLNFKIEASKYRLDPESSIFTFQIPTLKESDSVDTKTILLAVFGAAGFVAIGVISTFAYTVWGRKKNNFKNKNKM